ncbi:hypothetical protein [Mesorhizobium sp.]|uniref:hypothetical protein n=1 Tax=Mesorhizobium sp. TaxID=1871066 RepID=UPI0034535A28
MNSNWRRQAIAVPPLRAGLPADLAALLADADAAASRGALFDDDGALGRLIGRPTTSMQSLVAASLHG